MLYEPPLVVLALISIVVLVVNYWMPVMPALVLGAKITLSLVVAIYLFLLVLDAFRFYRR